MDAMDASAVLRRHDVRSAVHDGDVGTIVRTIRLAFHLTLAELGERTGYSASAVSRLETGKSHFADVDVRRAFAAALNIPPGLLGLADTAPASLPPHGCAAIVGRSRVPSEGAEPMRRRTMLTGVTGAVGAALLGVPPTAAVADPVTALENLVLATPAPTGPPPTAQRAWALLGAARDRFQLGGYRELAAVLPDLVGHTTSGCGAQPDPESEAQVLAALAELYTLATETMIKLGVDHLAWATVDRALHAANASEDLLATSSANRALVILLRREGRAERARRLVLDTAAAVAARANPGPQELSVYGALLSTAAYTAAVDGDRATANTLISEAADTARRLGGDGNHRWTAFGPNGVRLYQVSNALVLGDFGTAVEHARRIDLGQIEQPERRARLHVDVARAFDRWDKPEECFRSLLVAEKAAPDEVDRGPVHAVTTSLLSRVPRRILPQVRAFADRTGAFV